MYQAGNRCYPQPCKVLVLSPSVDKPRRREVSVLPTDTLVRSNAEKQIQGSFRSQSPLARKDVGDKINYRGCFM